MKCLIDADVLAYECPFAGQFKDELTGEIIMKEFDSVEEHLEMKINECLEANFSSEPPILFLTGDEKLCKQMGVEYHPNFRYEVAKTLPYKGNRKSEKPLHYDNIRAFMLSRYHCIVSDGCEADDMLATVATLNPGSVICSVDKDLRQIPGRHFTWSVGKREAIPPYDVDFMGELKYNPDTKKLWMTGMRAFYAQLIMGDPVDNIQGIYKAGPVKACKLLEGATTERELYERVREAYLQEWPEDGLEKLREHAALVWMVREFKDGKPVMYRPPAKEV